MMSSIDGAGGAAGSRDLSGIGDEASDETGATPQADAAPIRGGADPRAGLLAGAPAAAADSTATSPSSAKPAVLCPVLGAMIREGLIKTDANGNADLRNLDDTLKTRGRLTSGPADALTLAAPFFANRPEDAAANVLGSSFNPLELRGGGIQHFADSAILTNGQFDEKRFDELASHAHDVTLDAQGHAIGGRLTVADCAAAIGANAARDGKVSGYVKGVPLAVAELSAVVTIFGKMDPTTGERSIDVSTLRNLYQLQQLPPESEMQGRPAVGLGDLSATMAKMAMNLPFGGPTGIASQGVKTALGAIEDAAKGAATEAGALAQNALVGIGKALCPHLQGLSDMPSLPKADELAAMLP